LINELESLTTLQHPQVEAANQASSPRLRGAGAAVAHNFYSKSRLERDVLDA
jgi:hypothetical protein